MCFTLCNNNKPLLDRTVTWDKKIVYDNGNDQLSGWTKKKLQRTSQSQIWTPKNVMATVWWTAAHLIHSSSLNPSESITSEKYPQQISKMHQKLEHLKPALVSRKGPILLHNSAWPHAAQPALQKLNELSYEVLPHLPYPPDLPASDYHFFKHFNNSL